MGTFLFFADVARITGSLMTIVSLLASAAKPSLVTAECMPREAMPAGPTWQVRRCRIGHQSILRGQPDMPETSTFGRYAEIPYNEMTPEQQEGYRFLVETRGAAGGPSKIWVCFSIKRGLHPSVNQRLDFPRRIPVSVGSQSAPKGSPSMMLNFRRLIRVLNYI
jgi:hypothetical protein